MNASWVQLAMPAWDLKSVMDREVCPTGIQLTVENTGRNVTLGEIIQEEIIRYPGNIHL